MIKKYTKIEAAELQLETAIRLFFSESDPIPIETLCGAVIGILRPLAKKFGIQSPIHDSDWVKDEYEAYWINLLRKAETFSKHADKDPDGIPEYNPAVVPGRIMEALYLYRNLADPKRMNFIVRTKLIAFDIWFSLKFPHLIRKDNIEWQRLIAAIKPNSDPSDLGYFLTMMDSL